MELGGDGEMTQAEATLMAAAAPAPAELPEPNVSKEKRGFKKLFNNVVKPVMRHDAKPMTEEEKAKFETESELAF